MPRRRSSPVLDHVPASGIAHGIASPSAVGAHPGEYHPRARWARRPAADRTALDRGPVAVHRVAVSDPRHVAAPGRSMPRCRPPGAMLGMTGSTRSPSVASRTEIRHNPVEPRRVAAEAGRHVRVTSAPPARRAAFRQQLTRRLVPPVDAPDDDPSRRELPWRRRPQPASAAALPLPAGRVAHLYPRRGADLLGDVRRGLAQAVADAQPRFGDEVDGAQLSAPWQASSAPRLVSVEDHHHRHRPQAHQATELDAVHAASRRRA